MRQVCIDSFISLSLSLSLSSSSSSSSSPPPLSLQWILDFLVCNGLGIVCGMMTCHYLEMKSYHWRGLWKIPTLKGKLKRAVGQFTPYSWTTYQWGYTDSFKRFVFVCVLIVLVSIYGTPFILCYTVAFADNYMYVGQLNLSCLYGSFFGVLFAYPSICFSKRIYVQKCVQLLLC